MSKQIEANFSQSRNDMYWSIYALEDGRMIWTGYNDGYWWDRVAKSDQFRRRTGAKSGRVYILNPKTNIVTVEEAAA